ncbi:hypothetical protein, partial [Rhizobium laguerreae]|uniref:hypothetical protein n=1 Tax=Rhizobium laguerreae TaxID=1076926 RepID=UPI001C91C71C
MSSVSAKDTFKKDATLPRISSPQRGEGGGSRMSDYLGCQVAYSNSLRASRAFALRMTRSFR